MEILIDLSIALGAILAASYCLLLSRRLRALTRLDGDVGKAIAVLSKQVDDLTIALRAAEQSNTSAGATLDQQITIAEATARRLELLMAAAQTGDRDTVPRGRAMPNVTNDEDPPRSGPDGFTPLLHSSGRTEADLRRRVVRQREHAGQGR